MGTIPQKQCCTCREVKPIECFTKNRSRKDGYSEMCKVCKQRFCSEYEAKNKEKVKLKQDNYRAKNREKLRMSGREYRQQNIEKVKESNRRYGRDNKEKIKEISRKYYQQEHVKERMRLYKRTHYNKEHCTQKAREWRKRNSDLYLEQARVSKQKRRARLYKTGGSFTKQEWRSLCERYNHTCLCCNVRGIKLTADHIMPVSRGGSSNIDNIQPLCASCNSSKGTKHIDYRQGFETTFTQMKLF